MSETELACETCGQKFQVAGVIPGMIMPNGMILPMCEKCVRTTKEGLSKIKKEVGNEYVTL